MTEFTIEDFQRYTVRVIEKNGNNVTLSNPDINETFPLTVVSNAMQSIKKTEDNFPILKRFSITVEHWANSKYEAMKMFQETTVLLRNCNMAQVGTPIDMYDEITKKHRYGGRYEVNWNGLTNSLERII